MYLLLSVNSASGFYLFVTIILLLRYLPTFVVKRVDQIRVCFEMLRITMGNVAPKLKLLGDLTLEKRLLESRTENIQTNVFKFACIVDYYS